MEKLVIKINDVEVTYGTKEVLQIEEMTVYENERIGIVGKNGSGKTSLLRLLLGEITPTQGRIQKEVPFSYFSQSGSIIGTNELDWGLLGQFQVPDLETELLSGGEGAKYRLAATLSDYRPGMLLDEPTTHLDQRGIEKLLAELTHYYGTLLFVSHDRYFLDQMAEKIWEVDNGRITVYQGNYSDYQQRKQFAAAARSQAAQNYQQEKRRLEKSLQHKERQIARLSQTAKRKKQKDTRPDRLATSKQKDTVQKNIQKTAQVLAGRLERLEEVTSPAKERQISFPVPNSLMIHNPFPIRGEGLTLQRGERILLDQVDFQFANGKKIAITGDNGSGKTTFLKSLLKKESGVVLSPKVHFSTYQQFDYQIKGAESILNYLSKITEQPEATLRSLLHNLGFQQTELLKSIAVLSGGESTRIAIALALLRPANVLIMDEPTNFIDLATLEALEYLITAYEGMVIFTSHDHYFVKTVAEEIYRITDKQLIQVR